ncbi:hypothetical protein [Nocardioides sp.]|uniref:hypothetical protein n=1 Tax=Nocardioides sp. TaxID=35761 RepID=UPI003D09A023
MNMHKRGAPWFAASLMVSLAFSSPAALAAGVGAAAGPPDDNTGSLYSDLVVELREGNGTPLLKEYAVPGEDPADPVTVEYCVQPVSYTAVPGVGAVTNPLDGRQVWVLPLQGEWIDHPVDPLPVAEIEACDPQPQYAMFAVESELERLNLTRTSDSVLEKKKADVKVKLTLADTIGLDPAGRLTVDGAALDAAPEYAGMYDSLMLTGGIAGLDFAEIPYGKWQVAAVAIGAAASKGVPITVDTVQYYNRIVGFTSLPDPPTWPGLSFVTPVDPNPATPMAVDVLPGGENFVDYSAFTYNRSETFVGSATWLDVARLKWNVTAVLDLVPWTNLQETGGLTKAQVDSRTLTGVTAFAQMADDSRAVINYLHEHDQILPGFYMDPVLVDTTAQQIKNTTDPAVQVVAPEQVFQTLPFQVTTSLLNPWGGTLVDEGRLRITVDAPDALVVDDLTATATDGSVPFSVDGDGNLVGWWGPDEGFEVPPGYNVDTEFTVTASGEAPDGPYVVTLQLVDVDDPGAALAEDTSTVNVNASSPTVLWGGEIPSLGIQGTYVDVPVRVYAPTDQEAVLTFTLTGPGDDPTTDLLEELEAADARVYGSNGTDMVSMPLALLTQDKLGGTWPIALKAGYNDVTWHLLMAVGATVGQYGIDAGLEGGVDVAEPQYVSFAAPESHGNQPPDVGEDTTAPVVTITVASVTTDAATLDFVANEPATFVGQLTTNGVKGAWAATTSPQTFEGLAAGDYVFAVKATDTAGNAATYIKRFVVGTDTRVLAGPSDLAWVLGTTATFTLASNASSVEYHTVLNGKALPVNTSGRMLVSGLRQGSNRIAFTAVSGSGADPSPVVRTVYLPVGADRLSHTREWDAVSSPNALFGRFLSTRRSGQVARVYAPSVKRIALVVTKSLYSGKVLVYLDGRLLTSRPISLLSEQFAHRKLIPVTTFSSAKSGWVRVVVVSKGKLVRIEGIGIAPR